MPKLIAATALGTVLACSSPAFAQGLGVCDPQHSGNRKTLPIQGDALKCGALRLAEPRSRSSFALGAQAGFLV